MTARSIRRLAALSLATALLGTTAGTAVGTPESAPRPAGAVDEDPAAGKLLLMLDASGSMIEKDPSGGTKMDAAKKALTGVVESLPDTVQVGLRVYGAKEPGGRPTPKACRDTQLVVPVAPLDKDALTTAIDGFEAKGETPIAHSLEQAIQDVGTDGKRNIVLVSDGEESCVPDPCPAIKKLVGQGVDLQIDTVGFGVGAKARKQLQCLADAGHGTYYDAADADALTASLAKVSQRAVREYTVQGTPVRWTRDKATAPLLRAGQYRDELPSFTGKEAEPVLWKVRRTPGRELRVAVTGRPAARDFVADTASWTVELTTLEGEECDREFTVHQDVGNDRQPISIVVVEPANPDSRNGAECAAEEELLVAASRSGDFPSAVPVEIKVMEVPRPTSTDGLPEAADEHADNGAAQPIGDAEPIVGGESLSTALEVEPGTYVEQVAVAERSFYKIRADYGQTPVMSIDGIPEGTSLTGTTVGLQPCLDVWAPDRSKIPAGSSNCADVSTAKTTPFVSDNPEVRWLNNRPTKLAGYYYFSLSVGSIGLDDEARTRPWPIQVSFRVDGEPNGAPDVDGEPVGFDETPGPAPDAPDAPAESPNPQDEEQDEPASAQDADADESATQDDGGIPWLLVGLGALALLTGVAALALVLRGRGSSEHPA